MDDTTSRQQIDELADLYLTDPGQAQDATTPAPNPVEGPAPIKIAPKIATAATGGVSNNDLPIPDVNDFPEDSIESFDPIEDDHPVLRLTEDEATTQKTVSDTVLTADDLVDGEPAPQAMLEAVLMGNLPGMSGPWLTQYAQLLAQGEGPVILLHIGEQAIDLELIEPRAEAQPAPAQPAAAVRIPPMRGNKTGLVGLIDALVRSDATPARTILVRFDTLDDATALARLKAMDDWTLLCGSDSASIAAAGQQLRTAVHTDPNLADRHVGVMVMGSEEDASTQAASRIASELEHDLANPVEFIGHLKRMQPVQVRDLGSFPDPVALWPKLVSFFDSLEIPEPLPEVEPAEEKVEEPTKVSDTTSVAPPPARPMPSRMSPKPAATSRPEPMPRFRQAPVRRQPVDSTTASSQPTPDTTTDGVSEQVATPAARAQPAPTTRLADQVPLEEQQKVSDTFYKAPQATASTPMRPAPTPRVLTPQPELDLVALIAQGPAALDQPITLDARLPDQPDTQLAVDAHGTVHILLKKGISTFNDAALELLSAGQWVRDHLELLALTQRDRDFVDTAPVLHLLTDRADEALATHGKRAGQIKLHLLQQVTLGKETGWFCTPLG